MILYFSHTMVLENQIFNTCHEINMENNILQYIHLANLWIHPPPVGELLNSAISWPKGILDITYYNVGNTRSTFGGYETSWRKWICKTRVIYVSGHTHTSHSPGTPLRWWRFGLNILDISRENPDLEVGWSGSKENIVGVPINGCHRASYWTLDVLRHPPERVYILRWCDILDIGTLGYSVKREIFIFRIPVIVLFKVADWDDPSSWTNCKLVLTRGPPNTSGGSVDPENQCCTYSHTRLCHILTYSYAHILAYSHTGKTHINAYVPIITSNTFYHLRQTILQEG